MISPNEEKFILEQAYVPEHITSLMAGISGGEPFFRDSYFFLAREDWLIFIGYPLGDSFKEESFTAVLEETKKRVKPTYTWFIAPEISPPFGQPGPHRESDEYYKLDLPSYEVPKELRRSIEKTSGALTVERTRSLSSEHDALTREFLKREEGIKPRIRELFLRLPAYVAYSSTSVVLSARDHGRNLSAFYIVELGANHFATYVAGCFSRDNYVPHSSDLLFWEMIKLAREKGKEYLHLGLGVNEGIRRFKRKWGGVPFLKYESGELISKPRGPWAWILALQDSLRK